MKTEFEAKFYPIDLDKFRQLLEESGAELVTPMRLMKLTIFGSTLNPDMSVHYLRVRDEGDKVMLSAKSHARDGDKLTDQKEENVEVSDYDSTVYILKLAGLVSEGTSEKKRETWNHLGCGTICRDRGRFRGRCQGVL